MSLPDHHPGYITWDQFLANRRRLEANRTNAEGLAGRRAKAFACSRACLSAVCAAAPSVRYSGNGGVYPVYQCFWRHREALASCACLSVPAAPLDAAIAERVVAAVTPATIQLALAALTTLEERDQAIAEQWRRGIERARYEADLAERRYEAVDPNNRLVASTLEQRWSEAARRLRDLEAEFAAFQRQTLRTSTAEQKRQILDLAGDFPRLWTAPTSAPAIVSACSAS